MFFRPPIIGRSRTLQEQAGYELITQRRKAFGNVYFFNHSAHFWREWRTVRWTREDDQLIIKQEKASHNVFLRCAVIARGLLRFGIPVQEWNARTSAVAEAMASMSENGSPLEPGNVELMCRRQASSFPSRQMAIRLCPVQHKHQFSFPETLSCDAGGRKESTMTNVD